MLIESDRKMKQTIKPSLIIQGERATLGHLPWSRLGFFTDVELVQSFKG